MHKNVFAIVQAVWAALGPLVGVLLGAYLATRTQRRHWTLDNKKQEYRELLTTLTRAFDDIVSLHAAMVAHGPEERRQYMDAEKAAAAVMRDRIFIASAIQKMDLVNRWTSAARKVEHDHNLDEFAEQFRGIKTDILKAASEITQ